MTRRRNRLVVPEANEAMERLKQETANEVGVTINDYNPDIKAYEAGKVGGNMVRKMIEAYEKEHVNR